MDDRLYLLRWVNDTVLKERLDYGSFMRRYGLSWVQMLATNRQGMVQQGKRVYEMPVLMAHLEGLMKKGELFPFIGPSWASAVDVQSSWHSPDVCIVEEVVGPRFDKMDMPDYIKALEALAKSSEANEIQIGMLANPRKQAMLRYMTSLGMEHATSIVSKKV